MRATWGRCGTSGAARGRRPSTAASCPSITRHLRPRHPHHLPPPHPSRSPSLSRSHMVPNVPRPANCTGHARGGRRLHGVRNVQADAGRDAAAGRLRSSRERPRAGHGFGRSEIKQFKPCGRSFHDDLVIFPSPQPLEAVDPSLIPRELIYLLRVGECCAVRLSGACSLAGGDGRAPRRRWGAPPDPRPPGAAPLLRRPQPREAGDSAAAAGASRRARPTGRTAKLCRTAGGSWTASCRTLRSERRWRPSTARRTGAPARPPPQPPLFAIMRAHRNAVPPR